MLSLRFLPLATILLLTLTSTRAVPQNFKGYAGKLKRCSTVPQEVLGKETITMDKKSHLVLQLPDNHDWRTPKNGLIVRAHAKDEIAIEGLGGPDILDHNFVKISSKKFGDTQWVWLDMQGACTIGVDYLDIAAGTLYRQK